MPKLITTRTRIADLGKPRIIIIGGGFGGLEVATCLDGFKAQTLLFDKYTHHSLMPLLYPVAHLISLVGFKNKFFVLFSWIWSYLSYDKSNRLIIARAKDGVN